MLNIRISYLISLVLALFFIFGSIGPAMAGYTYLGNFYNDGWADYSGTGQGNSASWTHYDSDENPQYKLNGQNSLTVNDNFTYNGQKSDEGYDPLNNLVNYEYIIIKGGSDNPNSDGYADLYIYDSDGIDKSQIEPRSGLADISHAAGYNHVPVPGAAWLLGSGLVGLVAFRRRLGKAD